VVDVGRLDNGVGMGEVRMCEERRLMIGSAVIDIMLPHLVCNTYLTLSRHVIFRMLARICGGQVGTRTRQWRRHGGRLRSVKSAD